MIIFANPANLGLLQGPVDLYTDATFNPCTPAPFYQCLIVMIYDHSTSSFVPVLYALMTHKCEELYSRLFAEIVRLSKYKMRCRTYTSDFERGLMNQMAEHFGNHGGIHVGCFFHFKQAIRKYLIEKCGLGISKFIGPAMAVGGLDILCVLPRDEVENIGIPWLRNVLEFDIPEWEKKKLDKIFYPYFMRQWIPILTSWNLEVEGETTDIVNSTNNALESYNRRFKALFPKTPSLIKFAMIIETESSQQAVTRQDIITGKKREPYRNETWFPVIPKCYYEFKDNVMFVLPTTIKKKGCKKKAELSLEDSVPRSKRITRLKTANAKRM